MGHKLYKGARGGKFYYSANGLRRYYLTEHAMAMAASNKTDDVVYNINLLSSSSGATGQ